MAIESKTKIKATAGDFANGSKKKQLPKKNRLSGPKKTVLQQIPAGQDLLNLDVQLCFPMYAAARLMMQLYKPYLDPLGLTYPQYLVLLVLWERDELSVKEIGQRLYLDSATVIQILANLEKRGLLERHRLSAEGDGRVVVSRLTSEGKDLKETVREVIWGLACDFGDNLAEIEKLRAPLFKFVKLLHEKRPS